MRKPIRRGIFACLALCAALNAAVFSGTLRDASGRAVPGAEITVRTSAAALPISTLSDASGRFHVETPVDAPAAIRAVAAGFDPVELVARPGQDVEIALSPAAIATRVTVTATRGLLDDPESTAQRVSVVDESALSRRPGQTLGSYLVEEPGVLVQQSTTGQVSPFLRGLTGYHVLNLVDGIRFNNSTFRSGPNQYLAYIDPTQAGRIESALGPVSSQYGSDALGGAIQVVTPDARFSGTHFTTSLGAASADLSTNGAAEVSTGSSRVAWLGGVSGRRYGDLRGGGGLDSRNAFHRFFGMPLDEVRDLTGSRMNETGYRQYGVHSKLAVRPAADQSLTVWYQRGVLDGVRGYKDLEGGLGRLVSAFDPQVLDFFYTRYEKLAVGGLDAVSGTFSLNRQIDGGVRQNLGIGDPVTRERNGVRSFGYSGQGASHLGSRTVFSFGGDLYQESVDSVRTINQIAARPLYPDGASYRTAGVFGHASTDITRKIRATGGVRGSWIRFSSAATTAPLTFSDWTWHSAVSWQALPWMGLHALSSRGFRAPNLNDLGALGLNDLGFEVPASEATGALFGVSAAENAVSSGIAVSTLRAESLRNYEGGIRFSASRFRARISGWDAELYDPIVRRTLLFPAGGAPAQIGGQAVTPIAPTAQQAAQGLVTVATALDPRAVKAFVNDGRSRYWGFETSIEAQLASRWAFSAQHSFIIGRDLNPNRNIRRLPPQLASASVRYAARRYQLEFSVTGAGEQTRLSGGDRDDERIGASRSRNDIAAFFRGARVQAMVDASGRFLPTGETLAQIQDRVLPGVPAGTRVPLYGSTAGWISAAARAAIPLTDRVSLNLALENIADRNYRLHGSGIDAAGINAWTSVRYRF